MELKWLIITALTSIVLSVVSLCGGCQEYELRHITDEVGVINSRVAEVAQAVGRADYDDDEMLNLLRAIEAGNIVSSPWNPYTLPIGAGLTGIIALLEALRRKEQSSRKYAEHELRNNNKGNNSA